MAAPEYLDAMQSRVTELNTLITDLTSERDRLEQAIALVRDTSAGNGAQAQPAGRRAGGRRAASASPSRAPARRTRGAARTAGKGRGTRTPGVSEAIRQIIGEHPGLTAAQVAERGGLKRASTATAISKLVRAGAAERDAQGGLTLTAGAKGGTAAGDGGS
jgi:hypothetical protein